MANNCVFPLVVRNTETISAGQYTYISGDVIADRIVRDVNLYGTIPQHAARNVRQEALLLAGRIDQDRKAWKFEQSARTIRLFEAANERTRFSC